MLEKNKLLVFLIFILFFVLYLNIYLYNQLSDIIEVIELDATLVVSDKIGFDLNSTALTFGKVIQGSSSLREISINNNYGFPIEIYINGKGDIKNFIEPFKEKIEKNETKNLKIIAKVPEDTKLGSYNGKIIIKIIKLK